MESFSGCSFLPRRTEGGLTVPFGRDDFGGSEIRRVLLGEWVPDADRSLILHSIKSLTR